MQTTIVAGGMPAGIMPGAAAEGDAAAIEGMDFAALLMAQIQGKGNAALALPLATAEGGENLTLPTDDVTRDAKTAIPTDLLAQIAVDPLLQGMAPLVNASLVADDVITQDARNSVAQEQPVELVLDPALLGAAPLVAFPLLPHSVAPDPVDGLMNRSSDTVAVGEKQAIAFSGVMDLSKRNSSLPVQVGAAEFAVDGKSLPPDSGVKAIDGGAKSLSLEALPQSGPTLEDVPAVALKTFSPDGFRLPDSTPSVVPVMQPPHQVSAVVDARGSTMVAVPVPVGNAGWDDALWQKVVWMAGQQQQVAELHLNPPHLGPMEVHLSVSNDQVSAVFVSHQPAVREAIEAAMPRLREILADSGMMLGNATVSSDSLPRQQQPSGGEGQSGMTSRPDATFPDNAPAPLAQGILSLRNDGRGMVDFFA